MALRIYNNLFSSSAQRHLGNNHQGLSTSLERLSSGLRINRSADDAAGLAISEGLRGDIRSLGQAVRNGNDGIGMINTAEGAMSEQGAILIRMRELASQSATGTVGSAARVSIEREFTSLRREIDRISAVTEFNGTKLLDGTLSSAPGNSIVIQIGITSDINNRFNLNNEIDLTAMTSTALGIDTLTASTVSGALSALDNISSALQTLNDGRGRLGAVQNRLVHTLSSLAITKENLSAAESQIRDADYAAEISEFTRNQILVQASTAILAQANLVPQTVLQLLG